MVNRKKIYIGLFSGLLFILSMLFISSFFASDVKADTSTVLREITAVYKGGSVVVGQELNKTDFTVTAYYTDGTSAAVTDFTLSKTVISIDGENEILVVYQSKADKVSVTGKKVKNISASLVSGRFEFSIGNGPDGNDVVVTADYSDGTSSNVKDFTLRNNIVTKTGSQEVTVSYAGFTDKFEIIGKAQGKISSIHAAYKGTGTVIGGDVNRLDLEITAIYEDATSERITTYTLSPSKISVEGNNVLNVSYRDKTTTVTVNGTKRKAEKLTAVYNGIPVTVGKNVPLLSFTVEATFNDGKKERVTDFTIHNPAINAVGNNTITIIYQDIKVDVVVVGVPEVPVTFDKAATFDISNGKASGKVAIALSPYMSANNIVGASIKKSSVKRVYQKLFDKGKIPTNVDYIAFTVEVSGDAAEEAMPLKIRITLPEGYPQADTKFYFTPNRKTLLAEKTTEVYEKNMLQCNINQQGTYILSYNPNK